MSRPLGIKTVRRQAEIIETQNYRHLRRRRQQSPLTRQPESSGRPGGAERKLTLADNLQQEYLTPEVETQEEKAHRRLSALIWAASRRCCIKRPYLIGPSELNFPVIRKLRVED